jgi:serine/threonine-protein kinase
MIGTVLGDAYRLTREIGRGGMGAVYEGVQLRLNKRVAVKMMARELAANQEALARFRREAEVTSQLGHPHIVQVFDFGQAPSGEPYLVMEFLEGEDLDARIRRVGRMPPAAAALIVKQIASALAATHGKGIVHRDLKPANVFMLAIEGEADFVKVVDFGISKVRAATTRLTAAAAVMGTPNYMSPEQAAGRVEEIDSATDQWALACIAYEMLAGRPPFVGESVMSLLYQVVHEAPSPLANTAPGLPAGIEDVLRCALAKRPVERFANVTAFARAFEAAASGAPVSVPVAQPPAPLAPTAAAVAPTGLAAAPAPPVAPASKPAVTTFSAASGEAEPAEAAPARGRARVAFTVGAVAVGAIAVGAFAMSRSRGGPPAASPPPTAAAPSPPPVAPAPPPATPSPPVALPPAPAAAAAAPQPAARDDHRAVARSHRKSAKAPAAESASAAPAPTPPPAQSEPPDNPSWPPRPQAQPAAAPAQADSPTWPPQPAAQADAPTWPPPSNANATQPYGAQQPKPRKSLFKRIFSK